MAECLCKDCKVKRSECPALRDSGSKASKKEIERRTLVCQEQTMKG